MDSWTARHESEYFEDEHEQAPEIQVVKKMERPKRTDDMAEFIAKVGVFSAHLDHYGEICAESYRQTRMRLASV